MKSTMSAAGGLLVVLSSPSGGGKTTVIKRIIEVGYPDYHYSVSMTTRPRRPNEINGKDYWFVSPELFEQHIAQGDLIEYERVHDWFYGTPKSTLEAKLNDGQIVLLDLDVYGALELKRQFGELALLIFLKPPSEEKLVERLKNRSTETKEQIERRLRRLPEEMNAAMQFDAVIVNDRLDDTVEQVIGLIKDKRNS